jgi:hypothetical protein
MLIRIVKSSVGDPDPDPQDSHVFGPPGSGSGSICLKYGSGSFLFLKRLKLMCLQVSYKKKNRGNFFLAYLKSLKKGIGSGVGSGSGSAPKCHGSEQ